MPNWCYTNYIAEGPKDQLMRLHDTMKRLENMPCPGLIENDFGASWLGNLVADINDGVIPQNFRCRGSWNSLEYDDEDNVLRFDTETAWAEADDTRHMIEQKFPGVKLYYESEEFGNGIWESNDVNHVYFREEYYFSSEDYDGENYLESLDALIEAVEKTCGVTGLKTFSDCEEVADDYESEGGYGATIMQLTFEE